MDFAYFGINVDEAEFHLVSVFLVSTMDALELVSVFLVSTLDDLEILYKSTKQKNDTGLEPTKDPSMLKLV